MKPTSAHEDSYIKRVDTIVDNAVQDAVPIYQPLIEQILYALQNVPDLASAQHAVAAIKPDSQFIEGFASKMLDCLETADALGRSQIVRKDESMGSPAGAIVGKVISDDWFVCDDNVVKVSFDIIPEEALKILREKSLALAGVESDKLKNAVKDAIIQAIEKGQTKAEFEATINQLFDGYGITKLSPQHIDLVYRMNAFSAYNIAQANQATSMIDRFPLAFFSPIHDSKSRHIPLEGYYRADKVPLSPIDYGCRCGNIYIHVSQVTGNEQPFYKEPPRPDLIKFDQRASM